MIITISYDFQFIDLHYQGINGVMVHFLSKNSKICWILIADSIFDKLFVMGLQFIRLRLKMGLSALPRDHFWGLDKPLLLLRVKAEQPVHKSKNYWPPCWKANRWRYCQSFVEFLIVEVINYVF